MADFVAVLKKTIDGLGNNTPEMRERVYEKARATVAAKLAAISPPPPDALAERQKRMIEEAIAEVEASYGEAADPFAELENVFADIDRKSERPADAATGIEVAPTVLAGSTVDPKPWPGSEAEDQSTVALPAAERQAVPFDGDENDNEEPGFEEPKRRRNFAPLIAAVVALVVVAGGAYAVWLNKDDFQAMLGFGGSKVTTAPVVDPVALPAPATAKKTANDVAAAADAAQKFTQRLNSDGSEADEGPSGGIASLGEGTSVASATQPPAPAPTSPPSVDPPVPAPTGPAVAAADPATSAAGPAATAADPAVAAADPAVAAAAPTDPAAPAPTAADAAPIIAPTAPPPTVAAPPAADPATAVGDGTVPVSQKAIYYEERTNVAEGSAETGTILWSLVQESPGNNLPKEPAIRAEAKIPGKDLQLTMTIKRNVDKTIPASHTIELIFITPDNFDGGGIESILRFALKDTEESAGSALLGIPVKITDGYFLVALNDTKAEVETNLTLMKREQWIDVPLVYKSGRRALFTMEKGVPGDKVFDEAIKAWQAVAATAG